VDNDLKIDGKIKPMTVKRRGPNCSKKVTNQGLFAIKSLVAGMALERPSPDASPKQDDQH
jgi:hypothetical protein